MTTTTTAAVELRGVTMQFGGLRALSDVSLRLDHGVVTSLIGPNGAGKTTAINVISGVLRPTSGNVLVNGETITNQAAERRTDIARTFQISQVFKSLTVLENVVVALQADSGYGFGRALLGGPGVRHAEKAVRREALELLDRVGIAHLADRDASTLPLGQERLLEVARALAMRPKVILLDEVASGLTAGDRHELAGLVRSLGADGYAVLVVEHNMRFVQDTSEALVVLNFGELLYTGTVAEGLRDQGVMDAYLGHATTTDAGPDEEVKSDAALS